MAGSITAPSWKWQIIIIVTRVHIGGKHDLLAVVPVNCAEGLVLGLGQGWQEKGEKGKGKGKQGEKGQGKDKHGPPAGPG